MKFYPYKNVEVLPFEGSTLIMPVVSIGNVPQLGVDLLISNWCDAENEKNSSECARFVRVGSVDSDYVYPISSTEPFDDPKPETIQSDSAGSFAKGNGSSSEIQVQPIEVYQLQGKSMSMSMGMGTGPKYTLIQVRSPVLKSSITEISGNSAEGDSRTTEKLIFNYRALYVKEFVEFFIENKFDRLVLLTSSNNIYMTGYGEEAIEQGLENMIKVYCNYSVQQEPNCLWSRDSMVFPEVKENKDNVDKLGLKDSGISKRIIREFNKRNLQMMDIVIYVNEGDNVPEAIKMADVVNERVLENNRRKAWRQPTSWKWLHANQDLSTRWYY